MGPFAVPVSTVRPRVPTRTLGGVFPKLKSDPSRKGSSGTASGRGSPELRLSLRCGAWPRSWSEVWPLLASSS